MDTEGYVLAKVTRAKVARGIAPALIYRAPSLTAQYCAHIGVGTVFIDKKGQERLLTAAHLFHKGERPSFFFWRKVRPMEEEVSRGLKRVTGTGALGNGEEQFDVAILATGKPELLYGFSRFAAGANEGWQANTADMLPPEITELRSLVSGEKTAVIAISQEEPLHHVFIDYENIPGESGTGFIGPKGHVYVLIGSVRMNNHLARAKSILCGPFMIR